MKTKTVAYSELKIDDVIYWYGAKVRIIGVTHTYRESNGKFKGGNCTYFTIEPYDDKAIEILGDFYSRGRYGGLDILTVERCII